MQRTYRTNLNCGSCVAAVKPYLDAEASIRNWSVDTDDPRKVLVVEGDEPSTSTVTELVARAGFKVFEELNGHPETASHGSLGTGSAPGQTGHAHADPPASSASWLTTYRPLLLLLGYLLGVVGLVEWLQQPFDGMRAMRHFMAAFFLAFSFFKLLDLKGFSTSYQTYDILAQRFPGYGLIYPFLELALGVAYLINFAPVATNALTLALMLLGLVGVTRALLQRRTIQCACLGTVFNLPMSSVTFLEDALMGLMAIVMLIR